MGHEDLQRVEHPVGSSDRSFGLVFTAVFALIAFWPLLQREQPRWWSLGVAVGIAAIALAQPRLLSWPNRLWTKFGILLGRVVSPLALAVLFFAIFVPIGLIMRLAGKDPLRLKRDAVVGSYWIPRTPPGPPPDSIADQF